MEDVSDKIWVVAVWSPFEAESEIAARIIGIRGGKVFGNLIYGPFPGFPLKSSKLTISNWPLSCRKSSFERNCRSILPLSSLSLNIKLYVQDVVGGLYRGGLCATKHCDVPLIRPTTTMAPPPAPRNHHHHCHQCHSYAIFMMRTCTYDGPWMYLWWCTYDACIPHLAFLSRTNGQGNWSWW